MILIALMFASALADAPAQHTVNLRIEGLRKPGGTILCSLWTAEADWLDEHRGVRETQAVPAGGVATCTFEGVPTGEAAIFWMHDLNGNGDMDFNWIGLPTEPWGTSNDAPARFGPPKWDAAKVRVTNVGGSVTNVGSTDRR